LLLATGNSDTRYQLTPCVDLAFNKLRQLFGRQGVHGNQAGVRYSLPWIRLSHDRFHCILKLHDNVGRGTCTKGYAGIKCDGDARSITIVVLLTSGGAMDIIARVVAAKLSDRLGVAVIAVREMSGLNGVFSGGPSHLALHLALP